MRSSIFLIFLVCFPLTVFGESSDRSVQTTAVPESPAKFAERPSSEVMVYPETVKTVEMDNVDYNRIQCPGTISDIVVSKEHHVTAKYNGNNGFVTFQHMIKDGKPIYQKNPAEMHIICDGEVYTIIGVPTALQSSPKIRLLPGNKNKIEQNAALFGGMPLIKKCIRFVKLAYKDNLPQSFNVTHVNTSFDIYKGMKLVLTALVKAPGEGLQMKEYSVSNINKKEPIDFTEKDFLKIELTTNPQFISIGPPKYSLNPGESVRVFIVERTGDSHE